MKELIGIQSELKANKSQFNKFGNYKYRSCEDILEAVKPLLKKYNCILTISDEVVAVLDRVYVKATVVIRNKDGVEISTTAFAREPQSQKGMSEPQISGSASSYSRKYCLSGILAIDDTKDDDTRDNSQPTKPSPSKASLEYTKKKAKFEAELLDSGINAKEFFDTFNIREATINQVIAVKRNIIGNWILVKQNKIDNVKDFIKKTKVKLSSVEYGELDKICKEYLGGK